MGDEEKGRLVESIAGSLARVGRQDIIERSLGHFRKADSDLGGRLAKAVAARRTAARRT